MGCDSTTASLFGTSAPVVSGAGAGVASVISGRDSGAKSWDAFVRVGSAVASWAVAVTGSAAGVVVEAGAVDMLTVGLWPTTKEAREGVNKRSILYQVKHPNNPRQKGQGNATQ